MKPYNFTKIGGKTVSFEKLTDRAYKAALEYGFQTLVEQGKIVLQKNDKYDLTKPIKFKEPK